ncbi:MFS transporter [Naasia lichenicola]|uniref:MFS transporter n=1 Tax=Naasia lichenicola TaxID=2565933 RepID=A0A4S4FFK5_9MICO|nr:MFS transporter [Naasia lichenicola]THG28414.1 MFS transporter [Naasia lichenicola]
MSMQQDRASVFREPASRVSGGWIAAFAAAWLGVWMAQLTPIQLLLPVQVEAQLASTYWVDSVVAYGVISGIAGVCAFFAFPITGALSDRTTSRFGRRRPWIAGGAVLFAAALALLGLQTSMVGIGIFWALAITGFSVTASALTAMISDRVPVDQRGIVSGWLSAPQAIGTILGLVLVTMLITGQFLGYLAVAVLLVVLVIPFLLTTGDQVLAADERPRLTPGAVVAGFWISPRAYPDFGWTLAGRVLVNLGNALGTTLLLYFLMFGLGDADAEDDLVLLSLVYLVFIVIASLGAGRLSDRLGRRRAFVGVSAVLQGIAAVLLAVVPSLPTAIVGAGFLGLGYGCFLAVDQALASQVLPDPASHGKDLGIMNIAVAVPQAFGPLVGAGVVAATGGFAGLFLASAALSIIGAAAVFRVKGVR